jgi:hypothetical protein
MLLLIHPLPKERTMSIKTVMAGAALAIGTAGLVAVPTGAAMADDDLKVRKGSCSQGAKYTMRLRDVGDDPDRLRTVFKINSNKSNRKWTVRILKNGNQVHKSTKRTGAKGNVKFAKTFRGDDDDRIRVVARAGYGERCARTLRLDD